MRHCSGEQQNCAASGMCFTTPACCQHSVLHLWRVFALMWCKACHTQAMFFSQELANGVPLSAAQGVWLSADGFSPSSIGAGCFIFGLPTSGSCYHNVGNDACGDFQGSQATDDAVVCTTPGFFVPCLASRTGKLQVPWCVTYSMSSQASCQVVGPFTTANPDNRCYCGDSELD